MSTKSVEAPETYVPTAEDLADRARYAAMTAEARAIPAPARKSDFDANGRLLPISEEEQKARSEAFARLLDSDIWQEGPEESDEMWAEIFRNIDAERPHRKLFQGMY